MIHNYFGKQFPLDYRVYMIFFFESYIISIISATINTVLHKGPLGLVLQWSYIAFCTVTLFVIPRIRLTLQKPHLLFITFIYVPFLYFQTAGYNGTAFMFAPLGLFLLGIVFTGKLRVTVIALNILDYLVCIMISWLYPQTVISHSGPAARLIDLMAATLLSFSGISVLTIYVSKIFEEHNKTLAELSIRDALTGIYNRRFIADFLQRELEVAKQTENKFYVLMMDIDHFKRINDTYGHVFGDHVLLACIQAIQSVLRKGDVIARYGGEEFVIVLLPQIPLKAAVLAERIRQAVASLRFRYDVTVTVSIGVAKCQPDDTVENLISRADHCMYQAKQAGRNQVVFASTA